VARSGVGHYGARRHGDGPSAPCCVPCQTRCKPPHKHIPAPGWSRTGDRLSGVRMSTRPHAVQQGVGQSGDPGGVWRPTPQHAEIQLADRGIQQVVEAGVRAQLTAVLPGPQHRQALLPQKARRRRRRVLSEHRDMAAAKAFFRSARATIGFRPDRVTTAGHGSIQGQSALC
jgi:hypothetical protein